MKLCFIDFETDSVDPQKAKIIEAAALLFDTEYNQQIWAKNWLVRREAPLPIEIEELTGINQRMLFEYGHFEHIVLTALINETVGCDFYVAHNGLYFDKPVLENSIARTGLIFPENFYNTTWIDTLYDLPVKKGGSKKLSYLAADHGFVNPCAHRALADVLTLQKLVSMYDIIQILEISKTPLVNLTANVSFHSKDEAKKRGYNWNPEKKSWEKKIRRYYLEAEKKEAPFEIFVC